MVLTSRRAITTPEQASLRTYGGNGRGPGPRREEAALLAGVSVKLNLLMSWAATLDEAEPANVTER
jgi:hypothetical protein